jgi:hypothetical protein
MNSVLNTPVPFGGGPPAGVRHPPASFAWMLLSGGARVAPHAARRHTKRKLGTVLSLALMMLLSGGARFAPHAARRRKTKEIGMRFQSLVWSERPPGCRCRLRGKMRMFDYSVLAQSQKSGGIHPCDDNDDGSVSRRHKRAKNLLENSQWCRTRVVLHS